MVADTAAAQPLPADHVLLVKPLANKNCWAPNHISGMPLGRRHVTAGIERRDGKEFLINEPGAEHVGIERGSAFANDISPAELAPEDTHGLGQIDSGSLPGDDEFDLRMLGELRREALGTCLRRQEAGFDSVAIKDGEI